MGRQPSESTHGASLVVVGFAMPQLAPSRAFLKLAEAMLVRNIRYHVNLPLKLSIFAHCPLAFQAAIMSRRTPFFIANLSKAFADKLRAVVRFLSILLASVPLRVKSVSSSSATGIPPDSDLLNRDGRTRSYPRDTIIVSILIGAPLAGLSCTNP